MNTAIGESQAVLDRPSSVERLEALRLPRKELITHWVVGGDYAVAIEVDAIFDSGFSSESYLSTETVHHLEQLTRLAKAGEVAALEAAGTVYIRKSSLNSAR